MIDAIIAGPPWYVYVIPLIVGLVLEIARRLHMLGSARPRGVFGICVGVFVIVLEVEWLRHGKPYSRVMDYWFIVYAALGIVVTALTFFRRNTT